MSFSSDKPLQANQLPISIKLPESPEDLNQELVLLFKRYANAVNTKTGGLFQNLETAAFDQYVVENNPLTFRPVYRKMIFFGTLPNTATKSVAHGIAFGTSFRLVRIYGAATDPVGLVYIPLPYSSPTLNQNIKLNADATNVNVETAINYTAFTSTTIVLEYVKY